MVLLTKLHSPTKLETNFWESSDPLVSSPHSLSRDLLLFLFMPFPFCWRTLNATVGKLREKRLVAEYSFGI